MPRAIEWLLWQGLHVLFSLLCHLGTALSVCGRFLSAALRIYGDNVQEMKGVVDKPLTVGLVFENQEVVDDKDGKIPQLLFWLSAANVSHVTLYDAHGVLKRAQSQLQRTLNSLETEDQKIHCYSDKQAELLSELNGSQYLRGVQSVDRRLISVEKYNKFMQSELSSLRHRKSEISVSELANDNKPLLDMAAISHMKVELLSLQDGKGSLVRAARHLCENAYKLHYAEQSVKGTKLTEEDINKSLQETGCEGPDPDLLLLFGSTRSLLGFPPWRLRLSEIMHMGSLKDLSPNIFVSALKEFAKKTHRYGR